MGIALSPMHVLIILIILSFLIPIQRILHRTGYSRWWCLLVLLPVLNWIGIWLLAYVSWPAVDKSNG